jgi:TetR/AcrR family transcriptional regulator, transcriptional repressor for nem operon
MRRTTAHTKQQLIDTAFQLIWTSSYGAVSVDDICAGAGVKKGSFYHFFPSKVDLALATMDESFDVVKAAYDRMFSPATAPVKRFERLADFLYESQQQAAAKYGKVCGCPLASLSSEMAPREPRIRAKFEDLSRRYERYYENALRDMVAEGILRKTCDVKVKAQEVSNYFLGQLMAARIRGDLKALKRDLKVGLLRTLGVGGKVPAAA